jgi:hypothetical protein
MATEEGPFGIPIHCCPKQDRVAIRSAESKRLIGVKTVIAE